MMYHLKSLLIGLMIMSIFVALICLTIAYPTPVFLVLFTILFMCISHKIGSEFISVWKEFKRDDSDTTL